jgi:hypothetical protein
MYCMLYGVGVEVLRLLRQPVTLTGVETASEVLGQVSQHLLKTGVSTVSQHLLKTGVSTS